MSTEFVKETAVKEARDLLITRTQSARSDLVHQLETGLRDYADLRQKLEKFIGFQTAADVLAGYCHVETSKT